MRSRWRGLSRAWAPRLEPLSTSSTRTSTPWMAPSPPYSIRRTPTLATSPRSVSWSYCQRLEFQAGLPWQVMLLAGPGEAELVAKTIGVKLGEDGKWDEEHEPIPLAKSISFLVGEPLASPFSSLLSSPLLSRPFVLSASGMILPLTRHSVVWADFGGRVGGGC